MLRIAVGAGVYPHAIISASCGLAYALEFFEAPTTTANGTAVANVNHNRNSTKTSDLTVTHTPTVTAAGTAIAPVQYMGGNENKAAGGANRASVERILKPSTLYLARITSRAAANPCSLSIEWYHEGAA
jgi:hypothetical protein